MAIYEALATFMDILPLSGKATIYTSDRDVTQQINGRMGIPTSDDLSRICCETIRAYLRKYKGISVQWISAESLADKIRVLHKGATTKHFTIKSEAATDSDDDDESCNPGERLDGSIPERKVYVEYTFNKDGYPGTGKVRPITGCVRMYDDADNAWMFPVAHAASRPQVLYFGLAEFLKKCAEPESSSFNICVDDRYIASDSEPKGPLYAKDEQAWNALMGVLDEYPNVIIENIGTKLLDEKIESLKARHEKQRKARRGAKRNQPGREFDLDEVEAS
jgi:hypothetical protein